MSFTDSSIDSINKQSLCLTATMIQSTGDSTNSNMHGAALAALLSGTALQCIKPLQTKTSRRAPVGRQPARAMSSQMSRARCQRPPSAAARIAAVYACTLGAMRLPGGAARIESYVASARSVLPARAHTCAVRLQGLSGVSRMRPEQAILHCAAGQDAARMTRRGSRSRQRKRRQGYGVKTQFARVRQRNTHLDQRRRHAAVRLAAVRHRVIPHLHMSIHRRFTIETAGSLQGTSRG